MVRLLARPSQCRSLSLVKNWVFVLQSARNIPIPALRRGESTPRRLQFGDHMLALLFVHAHHF